MFSLVVLRDIQCLCTVRVNLDQSSYGSADSTWGGATKGNSGVNCSAVFIVTVMTAEDIRQISSPLTSKHSDKCQESQQGLRVNNNKRKKRSFIQEEN
jgi:hypothetical protein